MAAILTGLFGPNGSGKSFEAVKYHIVKPLTEGQPVATNVVGIEENIDKLCDYVSKRSKRLNLSPDDVRKLVTILPRRREDLLVPELWPSPDDWSRPSLIKPGSVVVLDECSTVLDKKAPAWFLIYVTEQRHGLDEMGHQGRMVIISQAWSHIDKSIRDMLAVTYVFSEYQTLGFLMRLLKPLGLNKDYRIAIHTETGKDPARRKPDNLMGRRRDPAIFALYKSVDGSLGEQISADSRIGLLSNSLVWLGVPFGVFVFFWGASTLLSKFGSHPPPASAATLSPSRVASAPVVANSSLSSAADPFSGESTKYRLLGTIVADGVTSYYVDTAVGPRVLYLNDIQGVSKTGSRIAITLHDGSVVTEFSGRRYTDGKAQPSTNSTSGGSSVKTSQSQSASSASLSPLRSSAG